MQFQALFFICCVWLLQQGACVASNDSNIKETAINNNNVSASSNNLPTNIANYQIKTTNGTDLSQVQLQEAAITAESNKEKSDEGAAAATNSSGKSGRRRIITPTGNANSTEAAQKAHVNTTIADPGSSGQVNNSTVAANVTSNSKVETQSTGEKMVAENVYIKTGNSTANTTKAPNGSNTLGALSSGNVNKTIAESKNATQINAVKVTTTLTPILKVNSTSTPFKSTSTTTSTTTTSTTSTTTTTTTTPKPKKPTITFGMEDFPHLEDSVQELHTQAAATQQEKPKDHNTSKLPTYEAEDVREQPDAEPSQELNANLGQYSRRDTLVPIITIVCTIPLAIGVVFTFYRRFKDFWSTRHYRRMDFLVDGMYND